MFLQNKYTKWYFNIILRAESRSLDKSVYIERHHVMPKSLGGSDDLENIVHLLAREHYICHKLLVRMLPSGPFKRKMVMACFRMTHLSKNNKRHIVNGNEYEKIRRLFAVAQREEKQGKPGFPRSAATKEKMRLAKIGTTKSPETREKIRQSALGRKHSVETKEKFKTRISNRLGTSHSEETKEKMRAAKKSCKNLS